MNSYSMGELEEGKTKSDFNIVVTEQMMDTFRQLSGDNNPLHTDQKYARSKGMKEKTVYGMLVASFYSKLSVIITAISNYLNRSFPKITIYLNVIKLILL